MGVPLDQAANVGATRSPEAVAYLRRTGAHVQPAARAEPEHTIVPGRSTSTRWHVAILQATNFISSGFQHVNRRLSRRRGGHRRRPAAPQRLRAGLGARLAARSSGVARQAARSWPAPSPPPSRCSRPTSRSPTAPSPTSTTTTRCSATASTTIPKNPHKANESAPGAGSTINVLTAAYFPPPTAARAEPDLAGGREAAQRRR